MKFESRYGIGEIVLYVTETSKKEHIHDEIFKVMSVIFNGDKTINYVARRPDGHVVNFMEHEIVGDPDFDQTKCYLAEDNITPTDKEAS